jgi:hypothetical protein
MHTGMDLFRRGVVPLLKAGDRNLIVVDADAIQPFFILGNMDDRDQGLSRRFLPVLRKVGRGKRYLQQLTDHQRLRKSGVVEGRERFRIDIEHSPDAIPVLFCNDGVFQV